MPAVTRDSCVQMDQTKIRMRDRILRAGMVFAEGRRPGEAWTGRPPSSFSGAAFQFVWLFASPSCFSFCSALCLILLR